MDEPRIVFLLQQHNGTGQTRVLAVYATQAAADDELGRRPAVEGLTLDVEEFAVLEGPVGLERRDFVPHPKGSTVVEGDGARLEAETNPR